jgi:hypothetical protein
MKISEVIALLVKRLAEDGDQDLGRQFDNILGDILGVSRIEFATAYEAYNYIIKNGTHFREIIEAEELIAKNPQYAFFYAKNIVRGRWLTGEPAILKNPEWCYNYVKEVVQERLPKCEAVIATSAYYACEYAIKIIKDRFPEGEAAIAKDPHCAVRYAKEIIKARWPEAEKVIFTSDDCTRCYAKQFNLDVIRKFAERITT